MAKQNVPTKPYQLLRAQGEVEQKNMKIGLLSDSHGNIEYVKKVGQYLKEKANVDLIVHLGDEYDDADVLKDLGIKILRVPGLCSSCYQDPGVPNRIVTEIEGMKILITHSAEAHSSDLPQDKDPKDIIREENIKAVFCGHTHIAKVENKNGITWINPGHLRESDKKNNPASFAIVLIEKGKISAKIINYNSI